VAEAYLDAWHETCPARMRSASLQHLDASRLRVDQEQLEQAAAALSAWASSETLRSLIITGRSNTGKTWLACGAIHELVRLRPLAAIYVSAPSLDLLGRQEADNWRRSAIGCDLLMVDDLDQPNDSQRRLRQVIMERYNSQQPIVACSSSSLDRLSDVLDDWLVRRLSDGATLVEFA